MNVITAYHVEIIFAIGWQMGVVNDATTSHDSDTVIVLGRKKWLIIEFK
jgi:hypothetical protein